MDPEGKLSFISDEGDDDDEENENSKVLLKEGVHMKVSSITDSILLAPLSYSLDETEVEEEEEAGGVIIRIVECNLWFSEGKGREGCMDTWNERDSGDSSST